MNAEGQTPNGLGPTRSADADGAPGLGQDTFAPSGAGRYRKLLGGGNLFLAGLFAAGIVCVYALSLRTGPQKASAEQLQVEMQVDAALSQLNGAGSAAAGHDDHVADVFYLEAKHRQVPIGELPGNPFAFALQPARVQFRSPGMAAPPPKEAPPPGEADAMQAVQSLVLQSVLTGSHGSTAMISNNLLTEGQTIRGWKVERIRPSQVELSWQGRSYVLEMPQ